MLNREFLQILVCPLCKGKLEYRKEQQQLLCRTDRLLFAITEDGIPVLLAEEATPFVENADSNSDSMATDSVSKNGDNNKDDSGDNNNGEKNTP